MNEKIDPKKIEKQLIPRLKVMGYILLTFAAITLSYRFTLTAPQEPKFELFEEEEAAAGFSFIDTDETALLPSNPKTYYIFSSIFALMGLFCITTARRRASKLATEDLRE